MGSYKTGVGLPINDIFDVTAPIFSCIYDLVYLFFMFFYIL